MVWNIWVIGHNLTLSTGSPLQDDRLDFIETFASADLVYFTHILQWLIQDFPWGGIDLVGGRWLPKWLRFKNFVCRNERIWTLGGGRAPGTPPRSANVLFSLFLWYSFWHFHCRWNESNRQCEIWWCLPLPAMPKRLFRCAADIQFDDALPVPVKVTNVKLKPFSETSNYLQYQTPLSLQHPCFYAQIKSLGKSGFAYHTSVEYHYFIKFAAFNISRLNIHLYL